MLAFPTVLNVIYRLFKVEDDIFLVKWLLLTSLDLTLQFCQLQI